jgi:choline dehydrogenase-like flavoprotein
VSCGSSQNMASPESSSVAGLADEYDFIIIGGGTAGLVLAARLTENPQLQIVVIEAGANRLSDPRITTPGLALSTWSNSEFDWCFETVPQV